MIKYLVLMITPLLANSYSVVHDSKFYSLHPKELSQALDKCPASPPAEVTCEQLNQFATRANQLVSELHYSPQVFGQKILVLQEHLAQLALDLKLKPDTEALQTSFNENKMQLQERLAIVKWLESPRG